MLRRLLPLAALLLATPLLAQTTGSIAGRAWFWLMLPLVMGNWMATVYLRYHYMIDVIAGWAAAAIAYAVADALLRLERRW